MILFGIIIGWLLLGGLGQSIILTYFYFHGMDIRGADIIISIFLTIGGPFSILAALFAVGATILGEMNFTNKVVIKSKRNSQK